MKSRHNFCILLIGTVGTLLLVSPAAADDVVEFLNGATLHGKVLEIRKDKKEFDFEVQVGDQKLTRTYSYDKVHAVTFGGKRQVLTEKPLSDAGPQTRSRQEINQYIEEAGKKPPDWFNAEPLEYPETLDLTWPIKAGEGWDNQKNVGQYIWDIVNPNPSRWRSGVKLLHHLLVIHKDDPVRLRRDMASLGTMYFQLFQDYGRAAFWLRRAAVKKGSMDGVLLAECYWRLGNKAMALEMLKSRTLHLQAIKLLGDMRETKRALDLANLYAKTRNSPEAYLLAGDACRTAGRLDEAIAMYQKIVDGSATARNEDYQKLYLARARESIAAIQIFDKADPKLVPDGTYTAATTGYSGPVEVRVKIVDGRIESVEVVRHEEKQFYSAITDTTNQIIKKQSVKDIDATSRATITSQAIVDATAQAMAGASQ